MNKKIIFFNILCILTTLTCVGTSTEQPQTEFEKFAEKFAPPAGIQETVDSAPKWPYFGFIEGKNGSPDIYGKKDKCYEGDRMVRVWYAYLLKNAFKQNNFNRIGVADKYFVKSSITGKWGTAAEFIKRDTCETANHYSFEEIEQLVHIQKNVCLADLHPDNFVRNENGQLILIDTDILSLARGSERNCLERLETFLTIARVKNKTVDEQSIHFVRDQIEKSSQQREVCIDTQKYNDTDINFEKAYKEFRKLSKHKK